MKIKCFKRVVGTLSTLATMVVFLVGCSEQSGDPTNPEVTGKSQGAHATDGDVCTVHGAPSDLCFICDAGLREKGRLWCREHARYEDRCWKCHPELEDKDRLWCKGHSLYEDECFLCHPELLENKSENDSPNQAMIESEIKEKQTGSGLMCREHGVWESECGICHPELLAEKSFGQGLKLRLPSVQSAERAGVVVGKSAVGEMVHEIECLAELHFDLNNLAEITPLVTGIIKSVEADLGSHVKEGDVLAAMTSVEIADAQAAFLQALAQDHLKERTVQRERKLRTQGISSENDLLEAEAAHASARAALRQAKQRLMVFGFDEEQIESLAEDKTASGILEIRAPFSGEIVERNAVRGAMAVIGKSLFTLTNTSKLWAMVNIPESQIRYVEVGQDVYLTVEFLPEERFSGQLTWLASQVDEKTRMALARVEVDNPLGKLKARMFGQAHIILANSGHAPIVPEGAVQELNGIPVVFVHSADDLFEARPVRLGVKKNGALQILAGLSVDDPVVVDGTFSLKSQFLISQLGAGCVH